MVKLKVRKRRPAAPAKAVKPPGALERILGWCVHGYTALGLVAASVIAVSLVHGGPGAFRLSFFVMTLATIVDATDGYLARKVRIKESVPSFDGRRLDDLVDFLNYTFLPLLLIWRAGILPPGQEAWLLLPLIASAYGFCQVQAKTDDGFFLGFPSLWNAVAFYLYVLPLTGWVALAFLIVLAVLTFVPTRHLYPSQKGVLNRVTTILGICWAPMIAAIIWQMPRSAGESFARSTQLLALMSLFYPVFYLGASWVISLRHWRKQALLSRERRTPDESA
jgi:phosphatidylcholine synthase